MMQNEVNRVGMILIVSGPSGTGKSTVCGDLLMRDDNISFSVSCTTRSPRPGEQDGREYFFISKQDFEEKIKEEAFIEYATVHGNYYGTLKSEVFSKVANGADVLLDIDVQGAMQIRERKAVDHSLALSAEFIFIAPPSFAELELRLRNRGTEPEDVIQHRLNNARNELSFWRQYDYLVINDVVDQAVLDLESLVVSLRKKTNRLKDSGFYD